MKSTEAGAILFLFYRKRTASFLANIYKASITGNLKDIHRARLDAKKIMAIHDFFDMLEPNDNRYRKRGKIFRPLFRSAGQIREIHVNFLLLEYPEFKVHVPVEFIGWLQHEEQMATTKFLKTIKKFKKEEFEDLEKDIKKICEGNALRKYRSKSRKFLEKNKNIMVRILSSELHDQSVHKTRKLLKAMSTIASMAYSLKPNSNLDKIISAINKTEILIGEWHDRVVLETSIDFYIATKNDQESSESAASIGLLKEQVVKQKLNYLQHLLPEIQMVIKAVESHIKEQ